MTHKRAREAHINNETVDAFGGTWRITSISAAMHDPNGITMNVDMMRTDRPGELSVALFEQPRREIQDA
jgi:hypothetical protein